MHAVIEHLENIILLFDIGPDILVVLLLNEVLPVLQSGELFLIIHLGLEPLEHGQQLPDQKVSNDISNLDILPPVHGLFSDCG